MCFDIESTSKEKLIKLIKKGSVRKSHLIHQHWEVKGKRGVFFLVDKIYNQNEPTMGQTPS